MARRRCHYAQSACLVVHLDLRSMRSGYFDVWSMGHLHGSVALMCVARSGDVASSGRLSSMAWAFEQWAAWFSSGLDWVQLVSRCGFVCGARTPRAIATSFIVCIHRGERGRCLRRRGDRWDHCGRSQRSGMDTVCPVAAAVAAGRSRATLGDSRWVHHKILAF